MNRQATTQLAGQDLDNRQTERFRPRPCEMVRQAHTPVGYTEAHGVRGAVLEVDDDVSGAFSRLGVLQGIRHQLIKNQAARDCLMDAEQNL